VPLGDNEIASLAQQALFSPSSVDLSTVALTKAAEPAPEQVKAAVGVTNTTQQQAQEIKAVVNASDGQGAGLGTAMGQLGRGTKL
jgi:hypothetical protein